MNLSKQILKIIAVLLIAQTIVFTQDNSDWFASGGGFKMNLPKIFTSSKDLDFDNGKLSGQGKVYTWEKSKAYFYQVQYYKLSKNQKLLSIADKAVFLENFKTDFLKEVKEKNIPVTEKSFSLNGNKGIELHSIYPGVTAIDRLFTIGQRFYLIRMIFNSSQDESQFMQILDSFSLLDSKSLIKAKIEEATPKDLPQEPVVEKQKTDAQNKNLKGKVKTVIEEELSPPLKKRETDSEEYYNESGNLIKEISFDEGYPATISVWGYIDGKRVSKSAYISFDDDQRPPKRNLSITMSAENNVKNPNLPRDSRYGISLVEKYNDAGQQVESKVLQNNGEVWSRTVFNYKGDQREELDYGNSNTVSGKVVEILDKDGNVIERNTYDEKDKIDMKIISTYEYDSLGNWIVKKDVEKSVVRGKTIMKPLWVSYRTITYYQ